MLTNLNLGLTCKLLWKYTAIGFLLGIVLFDLLESPKKRLFPFVVICGDALQSTEHGVVTCFPFVLFVLSNLQKPLIWTIICQTVLYMVKGSNRGNIYNKWCKSGCTLSPSNIQHILFRFGVNLQGILDTWWSSSLILSLMIIYDHFLMIIFDDHLWSPLRATLLNSLDPSAPKSPNAVFTFSNNSSSTFSS